MYSLGGVDYSIMIFDIESRRKGLMYKKVYKGTAILLFLLITEIGRSEAEYNVALQALTYTSINTASPFKANGIYRVILNGKQDFLKLYNTFQVGFYLPLTHESSVAEKGDFENFYYSIYRTIYRSEDEISESYLNLNSGLSGWLGLSRESRRRDQFIASVRPFLTLSWKKGVLFISETLRFGHRFYSQRVRADGRSLIPNEFTSITELSYHLTDRWSLALTFLYNYGISFENIGQSASLIGYYTSYRIGEKLLISLGLETQDDNFMPDGIRRRVTVFDPGITQLVFDLRLEV